MSVETNTALVHRMFEAISTGDVALADELFADDWENVDPSLPPLPRGPEGAKVLLGMFRTAFPDFAISIDETVAEGDKVAASFTCHGTNSGDFMGIPATGKDITITGTGIFRFRDGKFVQNRVNFDALGLMQQLGVAPRPEGAGAQ